MGRLWRLAVWLGIICGVVLLVPQLVRLSALQATYRELEQQVSIMVIPDATKVYVQTMPSRDKLSYRWQVHLPAGSQPSWSVFSSSGSSSTGGGTVPAAPRQVYVVQARLLNTASGWIMWCEYPNGQASIGLPDSFATSLATDRVSIQQLAADEMVEIDLNKAAALLSVEAEGESTQLLVGTPQAIHKARETQ